MTAFWIFATLMIAAALAFVLPPLIGRARVRGGSRDAANLAIYRERRAELDAERAAGTLDEARHAAACAELDRTLLDDVGGEQPNAPARPVNPLPAVLVAVAVPLAALGIYLAVGTPRALLADLPAPPAARTAGERPPSVEEMVARLEQRMRDHPEDPEGWLMLGRSYAAMNRLEDSRRALEEADRRRPDDPLTLVALAEVLAGLQGDRLDGRPIALVARALELEPGFPRALWLAGVHAFNTGDAASARALWQRLLDAPELSDEARAQVREAVAQAGDAAGAGVGGSAAGAGSAAAGTEPARAAPAAGGASITVHVSLAPALAARLDGSETVFVFARAAAGPRMPLAIARRAARELPLTVTLDDSLAMTPQMTLSGFERVVVGARISRSGDAAPAPGDLEGISAALAPAGAPELDLVIDRVVE